MFLLAHLSDPHIGGEWGRSDPLAGFAATVDAVRSLPQRPDAVLVTGDLADHAADSEYDQVRAGLATIDAPSYVLPGNHDDRRALHRNFGVPGGDGEPVQYSVDLGPLRLIVLDTTRPGEDPGALDDGRLDWLEQELASAPGAPTLIAMHHPPLITGLPAWDDSGLADTDRRALGKVLERHAQVRRVVAGHVHRVMTAELAGRPVLTVPSTYVQGRVNLATGRIELTDEPPGFALHTFANGELLSQIHQVTKRAREDSNLRPTA